MGKEWQDELNLNVYALDYRQYDPALGRFSSPDVLAEKAYSITPYRYGFNNPVFWRDPLGLYEDDCMDYNMEYNWGESERDQFEPGRGIQLADIIVMGWNRFERFEDEHNEDFLSIIGMSNDRVKDFADLLSEEKHKGGSLRIFKSTSKGKVLALKYYPDNFGVKSSKHAVYNVSKLIKKGSYAVTAVVGVAEISNAISKDQKELAKNGTTNYYNTVKTTASVTASVAAGMYAGAVIGTAMPIPIAGTVVGAFVGAAVGYFAGELAGEGVDLIYSK